MFVDDHHRGRLLHLPPLTTLWGVPFSLGRVKIVFDELLHNSLAKGRFILCNWTDKSIKARTTWYSLHLFKALTNGVHSPIEVGLKKIVIKKQPNFNSSTKKKHQDPLINFQNYRRCLLLVQSRHSCHYPIISSGRQVYIQQIGCQH